MTIASSKPKVYTEEEYLALEVESDIRSEYRDGEIIPMTGGTPAHNEITSILNTLLRVALKGQPYSIFVADQRLWIPQCNEHVYPDVMVVPRPISLKPGRKDTVTNPVLISEVLSKSTQGYDRGGKFSAYRTIPAFREYILIDQYQACVERYEKQTENQWLFTEYKALSDEIVLSSVPVRFTMSDLYEDALAG